MRPNHALDERMRAQNYFSVPEVADRSGISRSTLYDAIRDGHLKSVSVGKRHYLALEDVLTFGGEGAEVLWTMSHSRESAPSAAVEKPKRKTKTKQKTKRRGLTGPNGAAAG